MKRVSISAFRGLKTVLFFAAPLLLVIFIFANDASAQTAEKYFAPQLNVPIPGLDFTQYPIVKSGGKLSIPFFAAYVSVAYRYLLSITVIAAVVAFTYGAFLYLIGSAITSIQTGKKIMADAVIGMLLIFMGHMVLRTINSDLVTLQPITITRIQPNEWLDGVPLEAMAPWDRPDVTPGAPAQPIPPPIPGLTTGFGTGCGKGGGASSLPKPKCQSFEECRALFCDQKNYAIEGVPDPKNLAGFDNFPNTIGEQIDKQGLTFLAPPACFKNEGCDASKYRAIQLLGQGTKLVNKWHMEDTMRFTPGTRDALIQAGLSAKSKGFFLVIGDGTRSMRTQAENWCKRIKESGSSKGMATPGRSPHQLGVAVDMVLYKLENGKYKQLTVLGGICKQVENQKSLGAQNLKILEELMATAGLKHMCEEVWHFDYQGVYSVDCDSCEFPGKMQERTARDKTCAL